jgi:hypothetical protein
MVARDLIMSITELTPEDTEHSDGTPITRFSFTKSEPIHAEKQQQNPKNTKYRF